ncbi:MULTISPECIES: DUF2087 domain-containing protein [unclassified Cryobacterium]|uniref:DUF2087 domain-containing protein n=1 Tax=unclassified Cryobacterium TaxID=2649013 RepID=UPI00106BC1D0|nr:MULTISPECIES: DUF2087 domain-containing protein [unclassified Cryobacterium]TFD04671.1 DUF2087 domain-containing protein [Cryobacterium sp. TMT1-66-1]TFD08381.1 DUF2087 domain-containing protein [Cryobacterium sp. TMT1-2-2]
MANEWRRVVAALAHPDRRAVWAEAVLRGSGALTEPRTVKAAAALRDAGLLDDDGDAVTAVFGELLASEPEVRREGVERFIQHGRIERYPAKQPDRDELLGWVAAALPPERMSERELGIRLALVVDDVVTLRRYLVDAGLVSRTPDGAVYQVVQRPAASAASGTLEG